MTRILRFGKRIALAALTAGILLAVAQVVFAQPPIPSFTATVDPGAPATGCRSVTFTSTATDPDGDLDTIQWDFDGDGTFDASGDSVSHIFATAGNKSVTMRATDLDTAGDGVESADVTQGVIVPNAAPTAAFTVSDNPQAGQPITFNAATSADGDGTIASYAWDFGDGTNGSGATVQHTYNDHVAHPVSLTVTDNCGQASAPVSQNVTPGNTAPQITVAPTATVDGTAATAFNPGDEVTFAATATDSNNDTPLTYTWNFGDGTTATGATVQHTYATTLAAASVNVGLQVSDGHGGTTPATPLALRVNKAPVVALSNDPESPAVGEPVQFDASLSHDADASPGALTYAWDLDGNGTYVAGPAKPPTQVYNTVGSVTVGVRVTDGDGAVTPFTKTITVQKTRPTARLRFSPANPLPGQTITLTSTSVPSATAGAPAIKLTQWDFDYAATGAFAPMASGASVTTSFATAGVHTVAVRVTDGSNGTDIASAPIVVNARPRAAFTIRPTKPREGSEITFISTSSDPDGPISKQEWDLDNDGRYDDGTGVVASTKKLKHGTRTIRLRVTDSKGATDTVTQQIKVAAKPLLDPPDVNTTYGYARRAWGIRLIAFWVTVPARTTVKVTCKGGGCPRGTLVKRSKGKRARLRFDALTGSLRAGVKLTVISYRAGTKAEYFTLTVRGAYKPPLKRKRCKALTAKKYGSCG